MSAPVGNTFNNKYKPEYVIQAYKLCLLGATDDELADFFDVSRDTIKNWSKKYPEFRNARKRGKVKADADVSYSLYQRAVGLTICKKKVLSDGSIIEYKEKLPPDVRAIEYWLSCRQRDHWNIKQKVELTGEFENPLAFIMAEISQDNEGSGPLPRG